MDITPAYIVLESNTAQGLMADVNWYIKRGYMPQGGVSVTMVRDVMPGANIYVQAMVKTA